MNNSKYIDLLKREVYLWKARVIYESARILAIRSCEFNVAAHQLRDLDFTKEIGLDEMCWTLCRSGYTTEQDWDYLKKEWFDGWIKAYREVENMKEEYEVSRRKE